MLFFQFNNKASPPLLSSHHFKSYLTFSPRTKARLKMDNTKVLPLKKTTLVKPNPLLTKQKHEEESHPSPVNNRLIALLHDAIADNQQYPQLAIELNQQGSTTLSFILYPNGTIKNLKILHSAKFKLLDEAALSAFNNALPFKGVSAYLSHPDYFEVTVDFEV